MIEYEHLGKANEPFFDEIRQSMETTLRGGWYILGKGVERFEQEFARFSGSKHCIGVASGLDALTIALRAFDLPKGSEVLVPSNTYIATILSILQNDLIPVLVEPDLRTYNIDPELLEAALTPKTKAVVVVHLYGKPCHMDRITEFCGLHGLRLVEDCAQSHGARFNGKQTGTFGDFGAFSFYPTKNLGALGDAGALTTGNDLLAIRVRKLRNYGSSKKYYNEYVGYNSRLDELQAGILSVKLKYLDRINEHKRSLADRYDAGLSDAVVKPMREAGVEDVFHIYNIRHPRRDALREFLKGRGIGTEIHYPVPPHQQEALKPLLGNRSFPLSEEIHRTTLSLPISSFHTPAEVDEVIAAVNAFV